MRAWLEGAATWEPRPRLRAAYAVLCDIIYAWRLE